MRLAIFLAAVICLSACKKTTTSSPTPTEPTLPVIESGVISNAGAYAISLSATITDMGGYTVTEAGFVIDTIQSPVIEKNFRMVTSELDAGGNLSANITQLLAGTKYYARAYAKIQSGVAYSGEISFSTLQEKTFHGDVSFQNQQQIEAFAEQHYNRIDGELVFYGPGITDLTPLVDLVAVTKMLNIGFTTNLLSLEGLQNLRSVNTAKTPVGISITFNEALKNLKALEGITTTYGDVSFFRNYELNSLEGLDGLVSIEAGGLTIHDCDKLTNLHGLEQLTSVSKHITLWHNDALVDVSALNKLTTTERLQIVNNPSLKNVNGLGSIKNLKLLSIYYNHELSDITGLGSLENIERLQIDSNKLVSLNGLNNTKTISFLTVENSSELSDISAFSYLTSAEFIILSETGLVNMHGLDNLTRLGSLRLVDNNELESLDGLEALKSLEGELNVVGNLKLIDIGALNGTTGAALGAHFYDNLMLADFCPLKTLVSSPGSPLTTVNNAANPTKEEVLASCE